VSDYAFSGTKVTLLYLYSNKISTLSDNVFSGTRISLLHLYWNQLTILPDLSAIAGSLRHLFLAANRISFLPDQYFLQFSGLLELHLHANQLSATPNIKGMQHLRLLHISGNRNIKKIPDDAFEGTSISTLSIHSLGLETPPNLSSVAVSLKELSIGDNRLVTFPRDYFMSFLNLKMLYFNAQKASLTTVPSLQGLRLTNLTLINNHINLRAGDFQNVTTQYLYLGFNNITDVTPLYDLGDSLRGIQLDHNDLSGVTAEDLQRLFDGNLAWVHINNCNLKNFPDMRYSSVKILLWTPYMEQHNSFTCDCRLWWLKEIEQFPDRELSAMRKWTCAFPFKLKGKKIMDEVTIEELCPGIKQQHSVYMHF
jgi:hypothetical protein